MVSMNKLTIQKRVQILSSLVEGNSIRSTVRMTGASKNTVVKLLGDIGRVCEQYHDRIMVDLRCKRIQVDEIWSFCYAKQKNVPEQYRFRGDIILISSRFCWHENPISRIKLRVCQSPIL